MRVVLCGYYGQDNAGDEALLATLLQLLPSQVTPVVLSANPQKTSQRYGVEACPNRHWSTVWQTLRQAQGFVWGGGSLMQDVTSVTSPLYYAGLMAIAQWLGLKTVAWAQGIGPLRRAPIRGLTRWVLSRCDAISVRDLGSAALLKQWKLSGITAPDPVWLLDSQVDQTLAPKPVTVNLRQHPLLTAERLEVLTAGLKLFQAQTQAPIRLVPFQASQDQAISEGIADQLPGPVDIVYRADPRECKGLFQEGEFVIGMRLHSLIMAASEGCHCFALSYDPKVSQLMKALGLPGWELSALPVSPQVLSDTWQQSWQRGSALTPAELQSLKTEACQHQTVLEQVFSF